MAFILCTITLQSCDHSPAPVSSSIPFSIVKPIDTATFLASFPVLTLDSLYIGSEYDSLNRPDYILHGKLLDTSYASLVPDHGQELYAIGKITADPSCDIYLIRYRGEYSASRIDMLLYDKTTHWFTKGGLMLLAENFGDAGDAFLVNSVISKTQNGLIHIDRNEMEYAMDSTERSRLQYDSAYSYTISSGRVQLLHAQANSPEAGGPR